MNRIKENEIYDKFQDLCNSHKEISHFGDKHICNTECPLRDTNRCENVFFYQQGRADEQIQSIEDAKKQATEYLNALDEAKEKAYWQGKLDQKKKDNDFFNFEGAWELEKQKIRAEVIEEVKESIHEHLFNSPMMNPIMTRNEILLFLEQLKEKK